MDTRNCVSRGKCGYKETGDNGNNLEFHVVKELKDEHRMNCIYHILYENAHITVSTDSTCKYLHTQEHC